MPDITSPNAPGWPGTPARRTSSVKNGVGTALTAASKVWFTLSHGILDEIYYPRVDSACTRDHYWSMIRRAIGYIARNGPVSPQDRWEEDAGYSPFTLGAEIAALLVAADCADANRLPDMATYNGDGYGEHDDGRPFDGTGVGRAWPLLTGERGHYELAAGRLEPAEELARAMQAFAGNSQLLPEQVWDGPDVPEHELFIGQATGSARPLVWAHAEFLKLRRSIDDRRLFDQPPQPFACYVTAGKRTTPYAVWRFNNKIRAMAVGKILRVETLGPAVVHWGVDGWQDTQDTETVDTGLDVLLARGRSLGRL